MKRTRTDPRGILAGTPQDVTLPKDKRRTESHAWRRFGARKSPHACAKPTGSLGGAHLPASVSELPKADLTKSPRQAELNRGSKHERSSG